MECKNCKKDRDIRAKGLCGSCYEQELLNNNPKYKRNRQQYQAEYRRRNKEKLAQYNKERQQRRSVDGEFKKKRRDNYYFKKYGITASEFDRRKQEPCEICGERKTTMHADHNHDNGQFRGVLCSKCNNGLGFFNDNIVMLGKAIEYLSKQR